MDKIVEIRKYLAKTFEDECLADEILSFSVQMNCDFSNENFTSYKFMISFPGLKVRLKNDWKTQFKNCLSIKSICNLNVSSMEITDEGVIAIAEALKINSTLQTIYLDYNEIGVEGAIAIAEALKINSTLQEINLDDNEIGDEGAIAIAEALKINSTLQKLIYMIIKLVMKVLLQLLKH